MANQTPEQKACDEMAAPKPWQAMSDQLVLLKKRGMLIDNDSAALNYLSRIGYYRLSGYWYPLREIDKTASQQHNRPVRLDLFKPGSHFEDVVKLYVFDKKLRLLALDALERIEMAIRVDVAHLLGEKDPIAHINPDCLHGNFTKRINTKGPNKGKIEHKVWLKKYDARLHVARREPFVEHHKEKYGGQLPIWVAIEVWDFGLLSHLFAGMKYADKNKIAEKYGLTDGEELQKWLRSFNFIRNVSAHHSRLWNINVLETSSLPSNWPEMKNSRPFIYFAMMQQLLAVICPNSSWCSRLITLLNDFPVSRNGILTPKDFGVCCNWEQWLLELAKQK